jgi:hypothetical protein
MLVEITLGFLLKFALEAAFGFAPAVILPSYGRVRIGLSPFGLLAGPTQIDNFAHAEPGLLQASNLVVCANYASTVAPNRTSCSLVPIIEVPRRNAAH